MPEKDCTGRYPTWKWLVGVFVLIISFLLVRGLDSFSSRVDVQEIKTGQLTERVVRLETQYANILDGINDLKRNQERYFGKAVR